ncbi:hypothetical protein ACJMK2_008375 [Sinanodonta woodiana]|uniref:Menorin-like domain-containing protein n=1 Tax=Sinanodonta woodiana TaxID=1069815 RepID=A0ABD3VLM3_SINWO
MAVVVGRLSPINETGQFLYPVECQKDNAEESVKTVQEGEQVTTDTSASETQGFISDATLNFGRSNEDELRDIKAMQNLLRLAKNFERRVNMRGPNRVIQEPLNSRQKSSENLEETTTNSVESDDNSEENSSFSNNISHAENEWQKSKFYFRRLASRQQWLTQKSATGVGAMQFFKLTDASKIKWSHSTNSRKKLQDALQGEFMMIKADILLQGQGTENQTNVPIMAHPPNIYSDITFDEWIDAVVLSGKKGLELDFKSIEAVEPTLLLLTQRRAKLTIPVWLNADVLQGPDGPSVTVTANRFLEMCLKYFPEATLSLGFTTAKGQANKENSYTCEHVTQLHELCKGFQEPVIVPVRAAHVKSSWGNFDWLLQQSDKYSLKIWSTTQDDVNKDDMYSIYQMSEKHRVYFDLPDELMPESRG